MLFEILAALSQCTSTLLLFLVWEVFFIVYAHKREIKPPILHIAGVAIFLFFVTAMLTVAGVPNIETFRIDPEMYTVNFQLFESWSEFQGLYIANIIMFVPLGFFVPLLWPRYGRVWKVLLFCLAFSLIIEIMQLFNHRATDVDDLLMNTIGGVVGYGIYKAVALIGGKAVRVFQTPTDKNAPYPFRYEAVILILCVLLLQFFVDPFLPPLIAAPAL